MTAAAAGSALVVLASTGYAVMQERWLGAMHRANDAAYVLAAGAWLGALLPLLFVVRALDDSAYRSEAGVARRRFSTVGHAVVALFVATETVNTLLTLGKLSMDLPSPYQALLDLKITLVLLMIALAVYDRYRRVPQIADDSAEAIRAIRLATLIEIAAGIAVVGCVSVSDNSIRSDRGFEARLGDCVSLARTTRIGANHP